MCTVTWLHRPGGYQVFFNRDEKRTREPAQPPETRKRRGLRYLAPVDGRAGGTWLAVNACGLTLGLLNFYEAAPAARPPPAGRRSRGQLVLALIDARTPHEVAQRLRDEPLEPYPPFHLLVWHPGSPVQAHRWDGREHVATRVADEDLPYSTSSFDTAAVLAARRACWQRLLAEAGGVTPDLCERFQRSRDPRGDAYSVLMSRPDAETVSFSRIEVTPAQAAFHYAPRQPGGMDFAPAALYTLPRI